MPFFGNCKYFFISKRIKNHHLKGILADFYLFMLVLFDLKGENGSAGATLTVVTPMPIGDLTLDGEFFMANRGSDLRSNLTRGIDPKPWYLGLNAAAAKGGCKAFLAFFC